MPFFAGYSFNLRTHNLSGYMMTAHQIRRAFLDFFASKQHLIVPSAPLVPKNDSTLMFVNSGMAPFKDFFLGNGTPPAKRVADTQKCLRVSGKHNDLEDVGLDTYHHTLFEMLGNWSFGDYFKKEALEWAWEFLTEVVKLPKDRLYVTVFGGDKADNLPPDEEAFAIWERILGGKDRILYGTKKDNFWEMGDTGPCGPCSEIHIDLRPDEERQKISGYELVNKDNPQVIEIWNNVFMEFERKADKSLVKLPAKHVDTGMGFERLVRAIQNKTSNYDTDVFTPLIHFVEQLSGKKYGREEKTDVAIRVVVDHIRAVAFAIADGQLPSNAKAGYVIRRILRRAVRYGYSYLGFTTPFMCQLVPVLAEQFADVFPELKQQQEFVAKVILEEETSFLRTLENGLKLFEQIKRNAKEGMISGKDVFELYDTFGFPKDLTALIAREHGLYIDDAGFEAEMQQQKERARNATKVDKGDWVVLDEDFEKTEFVGYDTYETYTKIVKYRALKDAKQTYFQVVLDQTPFYAESGGQVGDTGILIAGEKQLTIFDTKKENDLIVHLTKDDVSKFIGDQKEVKVLAKIDSQRRSLIANNHSATHLVHAALRKVLGTHVTQKGSLVNDELLRFDFSHFAKVSEEELDTIEKLVNQKIRENIPLEVSTNVPIEKAKAMGAMALFGEKYGDFVRVVTFDKNYSVELCGGTHVPATGKIGLFTFVSESSVAAGVRRIEAITAEKAEAYVKSQRELLREISELLKNPKDLKKAIADLIEEKNRLAKEVEKYHAKELQALKTTLASKAEPYKGVSLVVAKVELPDTDSLKTLCFELRNAVKDLFAAIAAEINGKPQIAVIIADEVVKAKNYNAASMVKELAKEIKGGGGGQPFFATAGGSDASGLENALAKVRSLL